MDLQLPNIDVTIKNDIPVRITQPMVGKPWKSVTATAKLSSEVNPVVNLIAIKQFVVMLANGRHLDKESLDRLKKQPGITNLEIRNETIQ